MSTVETVETAVTAQTLELTSVHLGRKQKAALKDRARAKGTSVAAEIRNAVDAYLCGVAPEHVELLDAATNQAADAIAEMNDMLDATNRNADRIFAELEKLRGGRPAGAEADVVTPRKAIRQRASR